MKAIPSIILALAAGPATSGPWLRAPGEGFLAFGANVAVSEAARRPVHYDPAIFFEYGATRTLSLGLEAYGGNGGEERAANLLATLPLGTDPEAPVSFTFGLGWRDDEDRRRDETLLRLGLSGGRGLATGWLTAEASVMRSLTRATSDAKLDVTWGRSLSPELDGVLQLRTGRGTSGDSYAKLAPSVVWRASDEIRLEIGAVQALTGDLGTGLRLSTWWSF